jgi:hypothetical protein
MASGMVPFFIEAILYFRFSVMLKVSKDINYLFGLIALKLIRKPAA